MFEYSHLYTRLVEHLLWSGDPSVRGDPRKSVKWIDVLTHSHFVTVLAELTGSGPPRYRLLPRRPYPSRPRLGLRPLLSPRQKRRPRAHPAMAHSAHPLARAHRGDHLRLPNGLRLRAQTAQAIARRRPPR